MRKTLLGLMLATAALGGCASAPRMKPATASPEDSATDLAGTRTAWAECVRTAIPRVEDPQSPSEMVARAAMKGCSGEYTAMEQALAVSSGSPSSGVEAKAQRWALQAATEAVIASRLQVAGAQVLKCE